MFFFMVLHTSCGAARFVFSTLSARLLKLYSHPPALSIGFTKSLQNRRKTMLFVLASSPSQALARQLSQRESPWQSTQTSSLCQGLSLWERWHGVSHDGEGEAACLGANSPSLAALDSPLWDGALGMAGKFPAKAQSLRVRLLPWGELSRSD